MGKPKKVFEFYSDPGHGWLKVPGNMLIELNVFAEISGYSYRRGLNAYLEEDRDAGIFITAYEQKHGIKPVIKCMKQSDKQSKIRGYVSYIPWIK